MSRMSENGSYKRRSSEDGAGWVGKGRGKVRLIKEFYFATDIQGPAKHLSGNKDYSSEREENPC